jgi:hypothetical protein
MIVITEITQGGRSHFSRRPMPLLCTDVHAEMHKNAAKSICLQSCLQLSLKYVLLRTMGFPVLRTCSLHTLGKEGIGRILQCFFKYVSLRFLGCLETTEE